MTTEESHRPTTDAVSEEDIKSGTNGKDKEVTFYVYCSLSVVFLNKRNCKQTKWTTARSNVADEHSDTLQ